VCVVWLMGFGIVRFTCCVRVYAGVYDFVCAVTWLNVSNASYYAAGAAAAPKKRMRASVASSHRLKAQSQVCKQEEW